MQAIAGPIEAIGAEGVRVEGVFKSGDVVGLADIPEEVRKRTVA